MPQRPPRGMISSAFRLAAERDLLRLEMRKLFADRVDVLPEDSVAGTDADLYLQKARDASFIVILLTQEESDAVLSEVQIALDNNIQVAAFSLRYPPHSIPGTEWLPTRSEERLRKSGVFVRSVSSITDLQTQFWRAVANYLATATERYQHSSSHKNYDLFKDWLLVRPKRIALIQRTSTLLLGPRKDRQDEIDCNDSIKAHIERMVNANDGSTEFLHVFSKDHTRQAFTENRDSYLLQERSQLLSRRRNAKKNSPFIIKITAAGSEISPCLVVDNKVVLGSSLGSEGNMMSIIQEKSTASYVWRVLNNRLGHDAAKQASILQEFDL